ncbi:hypothetical protein Nepgr_032256 [Nepenthes gracilis]|uniref:Uncharacterized protein n=1 Tax=Nepenthes gracilis TaxID=150966 RepID=A0AAD3TK35_NEPGR|nr:hypothetical protein Nepgr_032256 [Nepenthes gracilis]
MVFEEWFTVPTSAAISHTASAGLTLEVEEGEARVASTGEAPKSGAAAGNATPLCKGGKGSAGNPNGGESTAALEMGGWEELACRPEMPTTTGVGTGVVEEVGQEESGGGPGGPPGGHPCQ